MVFGLVSATLDNLPSPEYTKLTLMVTEHAPSSENSVGLNGWIELEIDDFRQKNLSDIMYLMVAATWLASISVWLPVHWNSFWLFIIFLITTLLVFALLISDYQDWHPGFS